MSVVTLQEVQKNKEISALIKAANHVLDVRGYTDHGPRHVGYVSRVSGMILKELDFPERIIALGAIAGWVHDVGNSINRKNHGLTGAALIFPILRDMAMPIEEICLITSAIGNHEEETGVPVSEISSALILADKSDTHRTRVRKGNPNFNDIHNRVNHAIHQTEIRVDSDKRIIKYQMEMDTSSSVMEFLQIYMTRMVMSEQAAHYLGCTFEIIINGITLNNHIIERKGLSTSKQG